MPAGQQQRCHHSDAQQRPPQPPQPQQQQATKRALPHRSTCCAYLQRRHTHPPRTMQAIERTLQERQRFVKSKLASEGVPPTPPQLVAFLRGLVDMIRPHTGRASLHSI